MATKPTKIQIRRDTIANWKRFDPVLADGEIAISFDDKIGGEGTKLKVGRNTGKKWSELSYINCDFDINKFYELIAPYAEKEYVESSLALKADKSIVDNLEKTVALKADKTVVDKALEDLGGRLDDLEEGLGHVNEYIVSIKSELELSRTNMRELNSSVENLKSSVKELDKNIISNKSEIDEIKKFIKIEDGGTIIQLDEDTYANLEHGDIIQWEIDESGNGKWTKAKLGVIRNWD